MRMKMEMEMKMERESCVLPTAKELASIDDDGVDVKSFDSSRDNRDGSTEK